MRSHFQQPGPFGSFHNDGELKASSRLYTTLCNLWQFANTLCPARVTSLDPMQPCDWNSFPLVNNHGPTLLFRMLGAISEVESLKELKIGWSSLERGLLLLKDHVNLQNIQIECCDDDVDYEGDVLSDLLIIPQLTTFILRKKSGRREQVMP